jgi:hypothetical protein
MILRLIWTIIARVDYLSHSAGYQSLLKPPRKKLGQLASVAASDIVLLRGGQVPPLALTTAWESYHLSEPQVDTRL